MQVVAKLAAHRPNPNACELPGFSALPLVLYHRGDQSGPDAVVAAAVLAIVCWQRVAAAASAAGGVVSKRVVISRGWA